MYEKNWTIFDQRLNRNIKEYGTVEATSMTSIPGLGKLRGVK